MKSLSLLATVLLLAFVTASSQSLTKDERKKASGSLKETWKAFEKSTKGLSEEQLNFKPAPDKWSVKECALHLALSEQNIWNWMEQVDKAPANPEKRSLIKMSDDDLINAMAGRTTKVKTMEPFEPKNAKWATLPDALSAMEKARKEHISYMGETTDDMRNHVAEQTPFGALDAYQLVLFMSAHTTRHTKQIEEIKSDPNFPKK